MNNIDLITRDLQTIWHPTSQMKDYEIFKPLMIKKAYGSYLECEDGRRIIDAISSWWCKSLGHQHPRLKQALKEQLEYFEHVILANTTNEVIVECSEKLSQLCKSLNKVFYASDGACVVEIAMKMSLQMRHIQGEKKRTKFMALSNGYHGDTFAAMSVSDIGSFRSPFESALMDVQFINTIPYVNNRHDPLWHDCSEVWPMIEKQLNQNGEDVTAIIVEPIVQGAGHMKLYSQDFLKRLRRWTAQHGIHLIADEIMTGFYRTGTELACNHADIEPDFLCLSKGLTSGWLPFSAVLTNDAIYQVFYDDYETGKSFLHSHTYSGNALAASVAVAALQVMEDENIEQQVQQKELIMGEWMQHIAEKTGKLTNVRHIGAIAAADLIVEDPNQRVGYQIYQKATELGALLRPIGNTIYWLPPLNIDINTLAQLRDVTERAVKAVMK
jgi:adenosylmethionine---8-amino-7-oxononanoate aminotransferase